MSPWQQSLLLLQLQRQCKRQVSSRGISRQNHIPCAVPQQHQVIPRLHGILCGRGKGMLRCQPVVKAEYIHGSGFRQFGSQRSGIETASRGVAASVAVQDNIFLHMSAVDADPLPVHAVHIHFPVIQGFRIA